MKHIFLGAILLSQIAIAQEAGKIGELLRNEASSSEMSKPRTDWNFSARSRQDAKYQRNNRTTPHYRWHQNYGYTEIFLRIPEEGYFTVTVGDQMMSNGSGKFRFFDVMAGAVPLAIYQNGFLIYRTQIMAQANTRSVLDFFTNNGLFLLSVYPVGNQQYGFNDWNDVWNNPYNNPPAIYAIDMMSDASFNEFMRSLDNNAFDDGKISFIEQQAKNVNFTARQIKQMLEKISFDNNKLKMAKQLYHLCVDKSNFFIVYDVFTFDSYKNDLTAYIKALR